MRKLLLITHDEVLALAYRTRLGREGFTVEHCRTGDEGLTKARRWSPDLIVLDLTLPGMHGLDVIKWLREIPWLVKIHVVLLIERTISRDVLNECLLWGAGSYMEKDVRTLQEVVAHLKAIPVSDASPSPLH